MGSFARRAALLLLLLHGRYPVHAEEWTSAAGTGSSERTAKCSTAALRAADEQHSPLGTMSRAGAGAGGVLDAQQVTQPE